MSASYTMTETKPIINHHDWSHPPSTPPAAGAASMSDSLVKSTQASPYKTMPTPPPFVAPPRVSTLDLRDKLAAALGRHGNRYWTALQRFSTARISREEFEHEARMCLRPENVHLHNSMIFGIIYNASSAVPGPSALKGGHSGASERQADGTSLGKRNAIGAAETGDDQEDEGQDEYEHMSPRKRLRMLAASLPIKERQRIKAAGKPSERAGISGPNTSSWAGAGADLLEKRRKEEEKKSKEAERKRLREVHTEIGSIDWTRETLLAEAAKQEVRPKLPVATLQALLRSSQVPLCIERKALPEPEPLADLMTSQAVEAGLSGGVASEASQLLVAGLQAHIQDVAGSIIMAVRANRTAGGIRLSAHSGGDVSGETSADVSIRSGPDESSFSHSPMDSSSALDLPEGQSQSQGGTAFSVPMRVQRGVRGSDRSSRTSTSSNPASTAASSIFTTGSSRTRNHVYAANGSGPDASMLSLASTAPTSVTRGNSDQGSDVEMDDGDAERRPTKGKGNDDKALTTGVEERADETDGSIRSGASSQRNQHGEDLADSSGLWHAPLTHRPLYSLQVARPSRSNRPKLSLRDAAFLFELAPHVPVEPLGLSVMQRLLAPDVDEVALIGEGEDEEAVTEAGDDEASRAEKQCRAERAALQRWEESIMRDEEERLALAASKSALAKHGSAEESQQQPRQQNDGTRRHAGKTVPRAANGIYGLPQQAQISGLRPVGYAAGDENDPIQGPLQRKDVVIDQQAPLTLLARSSNVATAGRRDQDDDPDAPIGDREGSGASVPSLHDIFGKRDRSSFHFDPMSDVVDTTRLLAGLCD